MYRLVYLSPIPNHYEKNTCTLVFLFISCASFSQTFPLSGSTWIFKSPGFNPSVDEVGEKWVYMGDSIAPNGIVKKVHATTKLVNPAWYPWDTTLVYVSYRHFLVSGDTIRDVLYPNYILANFSVSIGDSLYSPYHHPLNEQMLIEGCLANDSALIYQKGIVTAVGTETVDGISSSYYDLKFKREIGDSVEVRFSQRSIITQGYWCWEPYIHFCNIVFESTPTVLVCYYDDSFVSAPCSDIAWFENLSVEESESWDLTLFPNPSSDMLLVSSKIALSGQAYITDIQGRKVGRVYPLNGTQQQAMDVSAMASGIYILKLHAEGGKQHKLRFIVSH